MKAPLNLICDKLCTMTKIQLQESSSVAACICERTEENEEGGGRGSLFMQQNRHREQEMSVEKSEISTEPVTEIQLLLFAAGYTGSASD